MSRTSWAFLAVINLIKTKGKRANRSWLACFWLSGWFTYMSVTSQTTMQWPADRITLKHSLTLSQEHTQTSTKIFPCINTLIKLVSRGGSVAAKECFWGQRGPAEAPCFSEPQSLKLFWTISDFSIAIHYSSATLNPCLLSPCLDGSEPLFSARGGAIHY